MVDMDAAVWHRPAARIDSGAQYIESLRGRDLRVHFLGERIEDIVGHPVIRPSINAVARTYDLANEHPELATVHSALVGRPVNRFLHVATSAEEVVMQNKMQRRLGQDTGTCFQRCVGMDAFNALYSVTHDCDEALGTPYHSRLKAFLTHCQEHNLVVGGAMTDPKGDRSKAPSQQHDPDLFTRIVRREPGGIVIRGAKAHQTGCLNSHWIIVMPTQRLGEMDRDYAVAAAIPVDHPGLTYVLGRQSCDTRAMEGGTIDVGNAQFGGQEAMIFIDDVFIPDEFVFMAGEVEFAAPLVERFTAFHRRSYVCKTGLGDVLIGAAAQLAEYHGVDGASHIKDKLVEMVHLNETVYGAGIASSYESQPTSAGNFQNDSLLANVCKHNVTRFPFELARLAQDIAGGLVSTLPGEADLADPEVGPLLAKYLSTGPDIPVEHRARLLRLVENLTMGRNAVGYLTESLHGAGSPQAQRVQIARQADFEAAKAMARRLAGIEEEPVVEYGRQRSDSTTRTQ